MKRILVLLLAVGLVQSCNMKKPGANEQEQEEQIVHDIDQVLKDLPDPSAIPSTLKSIGAEFGDSLINSLDNLESYVGDPDKLAINMGVYAADVNYLASYEKAELSMDYVRACHRIGETLGDSAIFQDDLIRKIEVNIGSEHQLSDLMREMIVETSLQLEKDHHLSMAALALTGSFIEEMYQAVNVIENYHASGQSREEDKNTVAPLVKLVMEQEQPLLDLLQLLRDIPSDDTILELITHLDILDRLYKSDLAKIQGFLDEDPEYVVDRDEMLAITLEIERIRASMVE